MKNSTIISLKDATAAIHGKTVLKNINWEVNSGEHWIIRGQIGSGKSALAKLLVRKVILQSGTVGYPFLGKAVNLETLNTKLAYLPFHRSALSMGLKTPMYYQQRYHSMEAEGLPTVRDILLDGNTTPSILQSKLWQDLKLLPLLELEHVKLSSGQTRRVYLAKVLAQRPKVLILDNLNVGLDPATRALIYDMLDAIVKADNTTLLLFGHYEHWPQCITHVLFLENGCTQSRSAIRSINFQEVDASAFDSPSQIEWPHPSDLTIGLEIIRFENVNLKYDQQTIFSGLNWQVKRGEKWAVVGANGSGKSSIIALIYADHPQAYSNHIYIDGKRRGSGESIWEIKEQIGFTSPEIQSYFDTNLTLLEFLSTGLTDTMIARPLSAGEHSYILNLLAHFNLDHRLDDFLLALSTGEQRLLFFLRALVKKPSILLLDEPFQGMDHHTIAQCRHLLDHVLSEQHTLVFITHYPREVPTCVSRTLYLSSSSRSRAK